MSVKVLENNIQNASALLRDVDALLSEMSRLVPCLEELTPAMIKEHGGMPKYVMSLRTVLSGAKVNNFSINYPSIAPLLEDGKFDDNAAARMHDALFQLGKFNAKLSELKCVVKSVEDRKYLYDLACKITGDVAVFMITQFGLYRLDKGVYLCVAEHCNAEGISPDAYYGVVLQVMDKANQAPYGYEVSSPYHDDLLSMDAVFLSQCEENLFPLTEDICKSLVRGEMSFAQANALLTDYISDRVTTEVEGVTTSNMLHRMNLN